MQSSTALETVLKRDRMIVLGGLAGITVLAWAYIGYLTWDMGRMDMTMDMAMPRMQTWGVPDLVLLFVMWAVMMVAMMVPSAAPLLLMFTTINRRRRTQHQPYVPTAVFLGGYLLVWSGFSVLAMLVQWGLHSAAGRRSRLPVLPISRLVPCKRRRSQGDAGDLLPQALWDTLAGSEHRDPQF